MTYVGFMEVRSSVLVALFMDLVAVAAVLAPGAGTATSIVAGIVVSMSGALLALAGLSWHWHERATAPAAADEHAAADHADDVAHELPAALAG
jgi:hypothetical protein